MRLPKRDREVRLTLDAHLERCASEPAEGEHLAGDLEHGGRGAEREIFCRPRLTQAPRAQVARVHAPDGPT